jgi:hypothetical protein
MPIIWWTDRPRAVASSVSVALASPRSGSAAATLADDLAALLTALARHRRLWDAFQSLLPSPDGLDALLGNLVRLAREAGELDEAIEQAEAMWDVGAGPLVQKRVGHDLQHLKRGLWHVRRCPPFGQLAEGVNEVVGLPVVDGLALGALACVLAGNMGLLATVGIVVRQLRDVA